MAKISELPDELLVKILTFLPTKAAVSTSVLSKQWEFLWMWLPELEFNFPISRSKYACLRDFIAKNLPLHKAPVECLVFNSLKLRYVTYSNDESLRLLLSCCSDLEHLSIDREPSGHYDTETLYSCNSLVTLKLCGQNILVDVPPRVCLPSLKTLKLDTVTYSNEDSLRLLLSCCPALEDLTIDREDYDNLRKLVIIVPSLQRLTLCINEGCSSDGYVIVTPSLKSLDVDDESSPSPYLIEHMPELEEADITWNMIEKDTERLLKLITNIKSLSLSITYNRGKENVYPDGIVFTQLETLKLYICSENWSMLLVNLLINSPNLRVLDMVYCYIYKDKSDGEYGPLCSRNNQGFLNSLETFKFEGYDSREQEDREFLSFIFKHARCLKSTSIVHR